MFNGNRNNYNSTQNVKKKPPPRPPPPNFSKMRSKSAWNLTHIDNGVSLIDLSPPDSPKAPSTHGFGGSASSSFSSSTSSLASTKKSFEYESVPFNVSPWSSTSDNVQSSTFYVSSQARNINNKIAANANPPMPTIIRPQPPKNFVSRNLASERSVGVCPFAKAPMPTIPPPSPPKGRRDVITPHGLALFDFRAMQPGDLELQVILYFQH